MVMAISKNTLHQTVTLFVKRKHIGRNPRFDREQHWAEFGDIGQTYGTLGRHWADKH